MSKEILAVIDEILQGKSVRVPPMQVKDYGFFLDELKSRRLKAR